MESIVEFWNRFFTFLGYYDLNTLISIFWLFFIFEFPRYYLIEFFIICYKKIRHKHFQRKWTEAKHLLRLENPFISILVPGKNEGKHIYKLIQSLEEQTYRNFELIVIDDGSDDDTRRICTILKNNGLIDLFLRSEVRGGKAAAANFGLHYAKGKYIVHLDADSSLDRDAIENLLTPFYLSHKIKGVGGNVKIRNHETNLCTSLQALEYLKTIMVGRIVTSFLGINHIISGALGAFNADTLRQIGGWDIGPGLDGDITQKIRKAGGDIYFEPTAVCLTNGPTTFTALIKQRLRWSKSLVRFRLRKHIDILLPTQNFNFKNFISNLDNIIFNFFFNILWVAYIYSLLINNQNFLIELFLLKFIIMIFFSLFSFGMIMWVTERRKEEFALIYTLPFIILYQGIFIRLIQLYAYLLEFFFFSSYKDPWNPKKTSTMAKYYKA